MIRTKGRMRLCVTLIVLNLLFIWGNSLLPGSVSGALSQWLKNLLMPGAGDESMGHGLLRKLAHFTEFCTLGMCLAWLFSMLGRKPWIPFAWGFGAACLDETIQCFVPDRGPGVWDVMIDTAGVCLGIAVLILGHTIFQKQKNK